MNFYVYEWFIKESGTIFYVGKGCNNRYKVRKHNKLFNYILEHNECESRIIKNFGNEKDAFEYEYIRINELWAQGQCKANIYKGGMGGTVDWWTPELKEKYSKNNVMKSKEQRERMSKNNPMKNIETQNKVKEYTQRKVIISDTEYKSVKSVCEAYNVCFATVKRWCKKGINPYNELCRYKEEEQIVPTTGRYNKGSCKEIIYKNKKYESPIDIAKELNISKSTVYRWAKKGFDDDGNFCRYVGDNRKLEYKRYIIGEKQWKPIIVNGVMYYSKTDAEKKLGLSRGYLAPYLNGTRKNKKFICEYVNQQPSHENSDKSIVEGSTTNE